MTDDGTFDLFIELSSALTGYDLRHDPWAMDVAETYLEKVLTEKGADALKQVLDTYSGCVTEGAGDQDRLKGLMSARLMTGSGTVPDLARSILWLWYLSAWYDKPEIKPWPDIYPPKGGEIVPGQAYTRGLAFKVGQSHPPAYSEGRYGEWGEPPPPDSGPFYPPTDPGASGNAG